jgi:hypothetical protein
MTWVCCATAGWARSSRTPTRPRRWGRSCGRSPSVTSDAPLPAPDVARTFSVVGYALLFVYGIRAAGIFMITTTSLVMAGGLLPRWLAVFSYLAAVFLLVSTTFPRGLALVFPAWVVVVAVVLLRGAQRSQGETTSQIPAVGPTQT